MVMFEQEIRINCLASSSCTRFSCEKYDYVYYKINYMIHAFIKMGISGNCINFNS